MNKTKKSKKSSLRFTYAVGRRKEATAKVRLYRGKGETTVNRQSVQAYFPGKINQFYYEQPFRVTNTQDRYYATVLVDGSGKKAQLQAVVHGLSRALDKASGQEFHSVLKKHRLLTRDSRKRERRKPGQMGRARKKKQSPKR